MTNLLILGCLVWADPPKAEVGERVVDQAAIEKQKQDENRRQAARILWPELTLLAILSILFMFLGAIIFIRRLGHRVAKARPRKRVKYFDLTVSDGPEDPPHEPTAEERLRDSP